MENPRTVLLVLCFGFVGLCNAIESPQYSVVHSESDFEIRLYRNSTWMSAPVKDISFEKATRLGFHRLFQYIQGANLNFSRIAMTAPVLTSIVPEAGPLHSSAYFVRLYLPVKFEDSPPLPLPELSLKPYAWDSHCIAVRKFSGFARDSNIVEEAEKLAISLSRSPWANSTSSESSYAYSIAQYNSPFRFIGRVNEVWVDVNASEFDGCKFSGVATY
ncbi:heme-binding protein 2-like [Fagus crenata]